MFSWIDDAMKWLFNEPTPRVNSWEDDQACGPWCPCGVDYDDNDSE